VGNTSIKREGGRKGQDKTSFLRNAHPRKRRGGQASTRTEQKWGGEWGTSKKGKKTVVKLFSKGGNRATCSRTFCCKERTSGGKKSRAWVEDWGEGGKRKETRPRCKKEEKSWTSLPRPATFVWTTEKGEKRKDRVVSQ